MKTAIPETAGARWPAFAEMVDSRSGSQLVRRSCPYYLETRQVDASAFELVMTRALSTR